MGKLKGLFLATLCVICLALPLGPILLLDIARDFYTVRANPRQSASIDPNTIQAQHYNAVVEVVTIGLFGKSHAIGSGVLISGDGLVLTAGHVLRGANAVRVTLYDGTVFDVCDYFVDDKFDIGFVDLSYDTNEFATLADSNGLKTKDDVFNVGNPYGIWGHTVTHGIVSVPHFSRLVLGKDIDFILLAMDVAPGCSGGGVYRGAELMGIVTMKFKDAAVAVPSNTCKLVLDEYLCQQNLNLNSDLWQEWLLGPSSLQD